MSILYRGPPIDASYQVSDHLAKWFQRRRILKISQSETRIGNSTYKDCSFCPISINKHGHHRRFLFLIGLFLKIFSSETALPNDPKLG
jgi:hypothetical protein